ncbi:hypothetical protein BRADI_5g22321v3 [Brachypodium distachyon]|uniref:Uncharacterized protein n=1 Tax=Brachypodium distachyon TaxID=15368 RepID=A0A0Q3P6V3_BRADI|nr:hypothetical protein BRADI_5g22321v3 [Brachypodium distachyon]
MSEAFRKSTSTSMGRSELGGGGEKSFTPFAAGTKGPPLSPTPSAVAGAEGGRGEGGGDGDGREAGFRRRSLASRRRARAPGRRKRRWSPAAAAWDRGLRVAAMRIR